MQQWRTSSKCLVMYALNRSKTAARQPSAVDGTFPIIVQLLSLQETSTSSVQYFETNQCVDQMLQSWSYYQPISVCKRTLLLPPSFFFLEKPLVKVGIRACSRAIIAMRSTTARVPCDLPPVCLYLDDCRKTIDQQLVQNSLNCTSLELLSPSNICCGFFFSSIRHSSTTSPLKMLASSVLTIPSIKNVYHRERSSLVFFFTFQKQAARCRLTPFFFPLKFVMVLK